MSTITRPSWSTMARVRLRAVRAPLGRRAGSQPEADVGDLRRVPHDELRPEHRVVWRLKGLADFLRPRVPREGAPEIVDPEKFALEQILTQPRGFPFV